jgi:hypothetical protein
MWAKLTRKLLLVNGKKSKLETIGRWRTLIQGLKTLEYKELRKYRERSLEANCRLSKLARKLIQRDNKMQSLRVIGRWRTLYLGLKTYDFNDLRERKVRRMQVNA